MKALDQLKTHQPANWQSLIPAVIIIAGLSALPTQSSFFIATDLRVWASDWTQLADCLKNQPFACKEISNFPLAYLINSGLLHFLQTNGIKPHHGMLIINSLFLIIPIGYLFSTRILRNARDLTLVYISAILLTCIAPMYLYTGALEVQAGVSTGIFLATWLRICKASSNTIEPVHLIFFVISGLIFPLYKDTSAAVVVASLFTSFTLKLAISRFKSEPCLAFRPNAAHLSLLVGIISVAMLCNLSFNWIRYDSYLPSGYLTVAAATSPSLMKSAEFLFASFFSPSGGILIFWTGGFSVAIWLLIRHGYLISRDAVMLGGILIAASAVGFSLWWAPFGWDAWGDRLMVPPALAVLVMLILSSEHPESVSDFRTMILPEMKNPVARLMMACTIVLSLHYSLVAYYSDRKALMLEAMFGGPDCQHMIGLLRSDIEGWGLRLWRTEHYYNCASERFLHFPTIIRNKES